MKNILNKKLNKKGFTLAELLIVVAIIAILVAIAMPLFFGALDKAEEATEKANIRAVRAIAVNEILGDWENYSKLSDKGKLGEAKYWDVDATIDANGNVTIDKITPHSMSINDYATASATRDSSNHDTWKIKLELTETDITPSYS